LGTFFARTKKVPRPRVLAPATKKVQTKKLRRKIKNWIPAYAGMTTPCKQRGTYLNDMLTETLLLNYYRDQYENVFLPF
jgi:hypothetical protein